MFEKRVSQSERLYETNHVTSRHGRNIDRNIDRFRDHGIGPIIVGCESFRLRVREQQCSKDAARANKRSCSSTLKNQAVPIATLSAE